MKTRSKLWLLAVATAVAIAATACGSDDENNANPDPDAGEQPDTGPPIDPDGGGDGGGPLSFPAYVQDLVTNKTSDTTAPDPEMVWGTLTDNEAYVFPATFFQ
jgi:hypothetical protein